jgi:2'-5' RNA ligase
VARLFLAIPAVMESYAALQKDFDPLVRGRWIPPERLHLTLLFLGERFDADWIIERLEREPLSLTPPRLRGMGYFKRNKILFVRTGNPSLQRLYETLCRLIEEPSRPLEPHVTLMRMKRVVEWEAFKTLVEEYGSQTLGHLEPRLILYQSELRPEGARYTVLKAWAL